MLSVEAKPAFISSTKETALCRRALLRAALQLGEVHDLPDPTVQPGEQRERLPESGLPGNSSNTTAALPSLPLQPSPPHALGLGLTERCPATQTQLVASEAQPPVTCGM